MELGLCMIVKNEVEHLAACLESIYDLFDDIVVVDTGSTDGTQALLESLFGITPISYHRTTDAGFLDFSAARNLGLSAISSPWVLALDADERVARRDLENLLELDPDAKDTSVAGYHCRWWNHSRAETSFLDYKLSLFRRDIRYRGVLHETVRHDIRTRGLRASWLDIVTLHHYPDPRRSRRKARDYRESLLEAIEQEPTWYRYHWFLGYMCFREGQLEEAARFLTIAAEAQSPSFPVECLNSSMVLAEIRARRGAWDEVVPTLNAALAFLERVADDFELESNSRLRPWLVNALESCLRGDLAKVRTYEFAV